MNVYLLFLFYLLLYRNKRNLYYINISLLHLNINKNTGCDYFILFFTIQFTSITFIFFFANIFKNVSKTQNNVFQTDFRLTNLYNSFG
ncbi:hypothetical protein AZ09_06980 [Acetobacter aceti 1023]|nr:hypothetical protein AZ09_06980 [Acetobacter aceti 1023]